MRVLSDLLMQSATVTLTTEASFPSNPRQGQFCFTGGILYIYATVNSVTTWFPLTNRINYYVHAQGVAALNWSVAHNLGSEDLIFMIYDEFGDVRFSSSVTFVDTDTITLTFATPVKGKAIVFSASGSAVGGGGGIGLNPWTIKTANYTASVNDRILADTSTGSWTLTLPATTTTGDTVTVADVAGMWSTHNLIVASQNGTLIDSGASPLELDTRTEVSFVYANSTYGWVTCR